MIGIRRVYEAPAADDGTRVLVDRLWPRGLSKAKAAVDYWAKDCAPSDALRREFHAQGDFDAFRRRYLEELDARPAALDALRERIGDGPATLLYGARTSPERSHAAVLRERVLGARR